MNKLIRMKKLFAVRGATSAKNSAKSISKSICELYTKLLSDNSIYENDIVSLQISITKDIDALNPASALRLAGLALEVPLFCSQEPVYKNSRPNIIRILLHFYASDDFTPKPVYLRKASKLKSENLQLALNDFIDEKTCKKKLWIVSREYAGIAEAGGLKGVVKAIAENSRDAGVDVKVFLPRYSFISLDNANCQDAEIDKLKKTFSTEVFFNEGNHRLDFYELKKDELCFIFVDTESFANKKGIYTYTEEEAKLAGADIKKGTAYADTDKMNLIFQLGVLYYSKSLNLKDAPDAVHCHDGHTAFLPALAKTLFAKNTIFFNKTKFFITIHNAGDFYRQQLCGLEYAEKLTGLSKNVLQKGFVEGGVEPFLVSADYATLTTVSPFYANELSNLNTSPFSKNFSKAIIENKIKITGIINGIDYKNYNPNKCEVSFLPFAYNPLKKDFTGKYKNRNFLLKKIKDKNFEKCNFEKNLECIGSFSKTENETQNEKKLLYFAYHGRIVHQKGIDILIKTIKNICKQKENVRFLIMGQGTADYEEKCKKITEEFLGKIVYFKGYDKKTARLVTASADFILLPSLFEPCGLEDFIAQIYGTIPIAHAIGGLKKIEDGETGFLFSVKDKANKFSTEHLASEMENIILNLVEKFENSSGELLENKNLQKIILRANKNILKIYNWKKIVREKYFPLFGF